MLKQKKMKKKPKQKIEKNSNEKSPEEKGEVNEEDEFKSISRENGRGN